FWRCNRRSSLPLAPWKADEYGQQNSQRERSQTDVEEFDGRPELEFHAMLPGAVEEYAARDEIAAQQLRASPVHRHAPVRVEPVVEQQDAGRGGGCGEHDVFRRIAFAFHFAFVLIRAGRKRQRFGEQNGLRRIERRIGKFLERGEVGGTLRREG